MNETLLLDLGALLTNVESAVFLSTVNSLLVSALSNPFKKKFPDVDFWWLIYVNIATGFAISWFAGANVFAASAIQSPSLGRVLTGLLIGGGAKMIYDVVDALKGMGSLIVSADALHINGVEEKDQ